MYRTILGVVTSVIILKFSVVYAQENDIVFDEKLGKITENLSSYQRCRLDNDCREYSFCFGNDNANNQNGYCKCLSGYDLVVRNRTFYACRKLAKYQEACEYDIQCVDQLGGLASCLDGACGCPTGTNLYPYDGRCHKIILLGDFCRTDGNCVLQEGFAYCTDGRCECNIGYAPSAEKNACIRALRIGDYCDNDGECARIGNATCREICRCQVGYVIGQNGQTCLKAATSFSAPCQQNNQCSEFLSGSVCTEGNCTCQTGRHGFENRCVRSSGVGQGCREAGECVLTTSQLSVMDCIDGICTCLAGATDDTLGCTNSSSQIPLSYVLVFYFFVCYLLLELQ